MNEHYLHFLWNKKRLPFHEMKTTKREQVEIINIGIYNEHESGPDFSMAKVRIDGLVWVGSIELHVKSSDWFQHKHHLDKAYNNVILHVVYIHDKDVEVLGRKLRVIELKQYIDSEHYLKYSKFHGNMNSIFPCKSLISEKHRGEIEIMKFAAIENRLKRKTANQACFNNDSSDFMLLKLSASAFGTSVNQQPFEQLINTFSLEELKNFDAKSTNHVLTDFYWKRKGLFSNPEKRLQQFIDFVKFFDFGFPFWELPVSIILLHFEQQFKKAKINSTFLFNTYLINCVVRFVFWKGNKIKNQAIIEKAQRLLFLIPSESNHLIRKWEKLEIRPKNAFDSQALLEIYQQLCTRKACLDCEIGKKILLK